MASDYLVGGYIEMDHYIEKIKEHEAKRLSHNERMAYWAEYKRKKEEDKKVMFWKDRQ